MSVVSQLVEMGFPSDRAERAVKAAGQSIDSAMDWLLAHQDELMDETPAPVQPQEGSSVTLLEETPAASTEAPLTEQTPGSFKCDDCGKLLRDQDAVMFHSSKSNHVNFSESTETIKPLTDEERAQKAAELKERLVAARIAKDELGRKEAIEKERKRREEGQKVTEMREKLKMDELKKIADEKKREKDEEKRAKQRILEQIRLDKEDRKAKAMGLPEAARTPSAPIVQAPKVDYDKANIQVRLPDGKAVKHAFGAREPLSVVRLWVQMNHNPEGLPFSLLVPFPRQVMTDEDYDKPLTMLGLVPSAVLVMTRGV